MDFAQAQQDIMSWLTDFVEQPNAELHGWSPCPYARKARLSREIEIRQGGADVYMDLMHLEMGTKTVIAYVYGPERFSAIEFNDSIRAVNRGFLVPRNLIAMADHPSDVEQVGNVVMNQGTWAIAFVQALDQLNDAAQLLAKQGYYQGWPEEYLQTLFADRQDPRS